MKDAFGNEIQVGDTVVCAQRSGSSQWLTKHQVVGIKTGQRGPYDWKAQAHTLIDLPVLETERSHTRRYKGDTEKRKVGPYKVHYAYRGDACAIIVIAKGPDASPSPVTLEGHDMGDAEPVNQVNPFDPVPGVQW